MTASNGLSTIRCWRSNSAEPRGGPVGQALGGCKRALERRVFYKGRLQRVSETRGVGRAPGLPGSQTRRQGALGGCKRALERRVFYKGRLQPVLESPRSVGLPGLPGSQTRDRGDPRLWASCQSEGEPRNSGLPVGPKGSPGTVGGSGLWSGVTLRRPRRCVHPGPPCPGLGDTVSSLGRLPYRKEH